MSRMILSVIIPKSQEAELTFEMAYHELAGIEHEIILSDGWADGLKNCHGEYVCFLEKDCLLTPRYFAKLLDNFEDKPSFRKLALVAPTTGVNSYSNRVYGLKIRSTDIHPSVMPSSSSTYLVQAAYYPGAIIRKSVIGNFAPSDKNITLDSVNLSLFLWSTGQRVLLDPKVLYITTDDSADQPIDYHPTKDIIDRRKVMDIFRRESIG